MGFLDKAKAAADQMAAKADAALNSATSSVGGSSSGQADAYLRDLGTITYLQMTGRPLPDGDAQQQRVMAALQAAEANGPIDFSMKSIAPATPPAPGMAAGAPPPPGAAAPPPAPGAVAPPPAPPAPAAPQEAPPPPPPPGAAPPPPPPSGG